VTHKLKTWDSVYHDVVYGKKTFEFRKNDRDFKLGDELLLMEVVPFIGGCSPTGRFCLFTVSYILHGGVFGVPEGYCIMSIERK